MWCYLQFLKNTKYVRIVLIYLKYLIYPILSAKAMKILRRSGVFCLISTLFLQFYKRQYDSFKIFSQLFLKVHFHMWSLVNSTHDLHYRHRNYFKTENSVKIFFEKVDGCSNLFFLSKRTCAHLDLKANEKHHTFSIAKGISQLGLLV